MARFAWLRFWIPVFLYAAIIFFLSSLPAQYVPRPFPYADQVFHFLEYFPFGLFILRASLKNPYIPRCHPLLATIFLVTLYAYTDEFHQLFVPGRVFDFKDLLVDVFGATAGGLSYLWQK